MSEENQTEDFDLDLDSDDIADLVSFVNPPDGTHIYGLVYCGMDKIGSKESSPMGIKFVYQLIQTVEKADPNGLSAPVGSICQESFTANDMGKKLLKQRLRQIYGDDYKGGAFRPYIEGLGEALMSNFHLQMTTKLVTIKDKKDPSITYENLRIKSLEPVACVELPANFEQYVHTPSE